MTEPKILAILTTMPECAIYGTPLFVCKDQEQLQIMSHRICNVMAASAHEIYDGCVIITAH
jgi:hypothetical protein